VYGSFYTVRPRAEAYRRSACGPSPRADRRPLRARPTCQEVVQRRRHRKTRRRGTRYTSDTQCGPAIDDRAIRSDRPARLPRPSPVISPRSDAHAVCSSGCKPCIAPPGSADDAFETHCSHQTFFQPRQGALPLCPTHKWKPWLARNGASSARCAPCRRRAQLTQRGIECQLRRKQRGMPLLQRLVSPVAAFADAHGRREPPFTDPCKGALRDIEPFTDSGLAQGLNRRCLHGSSLQVGESR
jgi:hypothetical protein